jgi:hypothetical protein
VAAIRYLSFVLIAALPSIVAAALGLPVVEVLVVDRPMGG